MTAAPVLVEDRVADREEEIVAVCPAVLGDAEHALGNLFQRMRHLTRVAREGLGPYADRITSTVEELERLLELVFDYVTPVELELGPVRVPTLCESLRVSLAVSASVPVACDRLPPGAVMADRQTIQRCFALLARALESELEHASRVEIDAGVGRSGESVELAIRMEGAAAPGGSPEAKIAWEVAGRLLELHGGELRRSGEDGSGVSTVVLPLWEEAPGAS